MKKELRYFQHDCVKSIIDSLKRGHRPYANCVTGFGKSIVLADLSAKALRQGKRVLQLVPNHTLCEQNYRQSIDYLEAQAYKVGMCSAKARRYELSKSCVIATQTSLVRRVDRLGHIDLCLIDECFSGDTLISTPNGLVRIDNISLGNLVYNANGIGSVKGVSVTNKLIIYHVRLSNGETIKTTNNHPIFTSRGWVNAEQLVIGDVVFSIQNVRELWGKNFPVEKRKNTRKKWEANKKERRTNKKIFFRNKVLLKKLFEEKRTQFKNSRSHGKNGCNIKKDWSQTNHTWRKWKRTNEATNCNARNFRQWMDNRAGHSNENTSKNEALPNLLSSRYWQQRVKNSHRNRWLLTQREAQRVRQEKRFVSNLIGVEGIQIEKRRSATPMFNLSVSGHPSYFAGGVLVHNCDMVALDDDTTYRKILAALLAKNPAMKIVGVTGSPYRQDQGEIHQGENALFTECCYESDIPRLINEGYLSSVEILNSPVHVNLDDVKIVRGEYDQGQVGVKFDAIIADAVKDFKQLFQQHNIKSALIFASTIDNGQKIVNTYNNPNECKLAHGGLNNHERHKIIDWLTNSDGNRYLVNVGLYTRGFDYPALESLVLLRATKSLRLYVQIIGRLLRVHDEKPFGYLIDYGTNVERFGPIDSLKPPEPPGKGEAPMKYCLMPMCGAENRLSAKECKECGAVFVSENDDGDYSMKSKGEILREKEMKKWIEIIDPLLAFEMAFSRKDGTPMVKMKIHDKYRLVHDQYICIEHSGYAGSNAVKFMMQLFKNREDFFTLSTENELTAENLNLLFNSYYDQYFKKIKRIIIGPGKDKYKEIKGIEYGN